MRNAWGDFLAYLGPRPIALLNNLCHGPALGVVAFLAQHVLDHHGRREGRGDGEDLEVAAG